MKKFPGKFKIKNVLKIINPKKLLKVLNPKNILKVFGFKNLLIAALAVTLVVLICYGIGTGFGGGAGSGEGDGNSKVNTNGENEDMIEVVEEDVIPTTKPKEKALEEQEGADVFEGAILAIIVVGNDYFYDNERILLEDFIAIVKEVEGKLVVEVKDDNASLKAYNSLLDSLDEINIDYVEK